MWTKKQETSAPVAVKIKLKRLGKKRHPQYRIVIADARARRDGRSIEEIGIYHPMEEPSLIRVDGERARYWLGVGAQPTEAVQRILEITGDWQAHHGLPGAEGTLKVAEAKVDKRAVFEAAAKDAAGEKDRFAKEQSDKAKKAANEARRAEEQARGEAEQAAAEQSSSPAEEGTAAGADAAPAQAVAGDEPAAAAADQA
jgi:small subunit ribosomal protein S16